MKNEDFENVYFTCDKLSTCKIDKYYLCKDDACALAKKMIKKENGWVGYYIRFSNTTRQPLRIEDFLLYNKDKANLDLSSTYRIASEGAFNMYIMYLSTGLGSYYTHCMKELINQ